MTIQMDTWENRLLRLAYAPQENWAGTRETALADPPALNRAYTHSEEITKEHSATFHLASALLPEEQRQAIRALYAFCRVSDDLVDKPQGQGASATTEVARFERWRQRSLSNNPREEELVASAWADTRARFNIPRQYAEQLLDGVASDLTVKRYATFPDLANYCYGVASTVGLMSMHIVGFKDDSAIPYAVKLGVALQLTNILRDVAEDWENGRLYLPLEELAAFGLSEADIAAQTNDGRWKAFMAFQIERARRLYAEAMPGLVLLERRGRVAVAAAAELYCAILDDIEAHDYDVFSRRAYISNRQKVVRIPGIWWRAMAGKY
ncbi:MAG: squalene/phytoene synthase family protein [Chloroflexi bacterium]|jgi:phytoene synthase|nr:squalene/phytoene synthase family protein [Chloroflexota bacterium]